jgi:tRNA threonylcarbamoyladenosine biosynthesis protein TsaE
MKKLISKSEKETIKLAKKIAKDFEFGTILALVGNLGSGKTQFTKGLAEFYQIKNPITSPTFVVMKQYNISQKVKKEKEKSSLRKLIHIDAYRLSSSEELMALGLKDLIEDKNNIVIIEWADRIKSILPKNAKWIKFKVGKKENEREISF